jgi:hypothetical protein
MSKYKVERATGIFLGQGPRYDLNVMGFELSYFLALLG